MGTAAVIWLGILVWVVLAVVVGLALGRMIRLRDRHGPDSAEPVPPAEGESGRASFLGRITGDLGKS